MPGVKPYIFPIREGVPALRPVTNHYGYCIKALEEKALSTAGSGLSYLSQMFGNASTLAILTK